MFKYYFKSTKVPSNKTHCDFVLGKTITKPQGELRNDVGNRQRIEIDKKELEFFSTNYWYPLSYFLSHSAENWK